MKIPVSAKILLLTFFLAFSAAQAQFTYKSTFNKTARTAVIDMSMDEPDYDPKLKSVQAMPQPASNFEKLKVQLDDLKKTGISERWSRDQNQIQRLDGEIKGLVKQRSGYLGALKAIENKYIGNAASTQSQADEQKLQANLKLLKKDNKRLQKQAADFRLEMVGLDKKKSGLENILGLNK